MLIYRIGGKIYKAETLREFPSDYVNQGYVPLKKDGSFGSSVTYGYYDNNRTCLTRVKTIFGDDRINIYPNSYWTRTDVLGYALEDGKLHEFLDCKYKEISLSRDISELFALVIKQLSKTKENSEVYFEEISIINQFLKESLSVAGYENLNIKEVSRCTK